MSMLRLVTLASFSFFLCQSSIFGNSPIQIPFLKVGKLILVEGSVNNKIGLFIVDTGAPQLILNKAHFDGIKNKRSIITGVNEDALNSEEVYFKELVISDLTIKTQMARVIDLSHLEKSKGIEILGLAGFSILRKHEIHFDFLNQKLILYPIDKKGNSTPSFSSPTYSIPFNMTGHIPYISAFVGSQEINLGLDSGTEATVILSRVLKNRINHFSASNRVIVRGVSHNNRKQAHGSIDLIQIGETYYPNLEIILLNVPKLEGFGHVNLDGLLAISHLTNTRLAINYKKKTFYLWSEEKIEIASKRESFSGKSTFKR